MSIVTIKPKFSYADILKKNANISETDSSESASDSSSHDSPRFTMFRELSTDEPTYLELNSHSSDETNQESEDKSVEDKKIFKLPGGKRYQKDGDRLEKAFYNSLPKNIKNKISVNIKPRYSNGNVIVEFDMIYRSDSSKRIVSFEIKGVNKHTTDNIERQNKLISQGLRQKKYLLENFSDYNIDIVYCFVTGINKRTEETKINKDTEWKCVYSNEQKKSLDNDFLKKIKLNGINVAIGETPMQCAKKALKMMNLLR